MLDALFHFTHIPRTETFDCFIFHIDSFAGFSYLTKGYEKIWV